MIERMRIAAAACLLAAAPAADLFGESLSDRRLIQSPDGSVLAVALKPGVVEFLGADGTVLSTLPLPSGAVELSFAPDGQKAALALWGGGVALANVRGGAVQTFDGGRACSSLTWSPDGRRVLYLRKDADKVELAALDVAAGTVKTLRSLQTPSSARADGSGVPPPPAAPQSAAPSPEPPPSGDFPVPGARPDARGRLPMGKRPQ